MNFPKLANFDWTHSLRNVGLINLTVLTLSWGRPLSYRNQSIALRTKSMDWFLYDNGLSHERVKKINFQNCWENNFINPPTLSVYRQLLLLIHLQSLTTDHLPLITDTRNHFTNIRLKYCILYILMKADHLQKQIKTFYMEQLSLPIDLRWSPGLIMLY